MLKLNGKNSVLFKLYFHFTIITVVLVACLSAALWRAFLTVYHQDVKVTVQDLLNLQGREIETKVILSAVDQVFDLSMNSTDDISYFFKATEIENYYKIQTIHNSIQKIRSLNESMIQELCLYSKNKNISLSTETGLTFLNKSEYSIPNYENMFENNLDQEVNGWYYEENSREIYYKMFYPLGEDPQTADGYIMLKIDPQIIDSIFLTDSYVSDGSRYYLTDSFGEVIAANHQEDILLEQDMEKIERYLYKGEHSVFEFEPIRLSNGWTIFYTTSSQSLHQGIQVISVLLIVLFFLFVVVWICVSLFFFRRTQKPLKLLIATIKGLPYIRPGNKVLNEYELIEETIESMNNELIHVENVMQTNRKTLKNELLVTLLFHASFDLEQIYDLMEKIGITFLNSNFTVILFQIPPDTVCLMDEEARIDEYLAQQVEKISTQEDQFYAAFVSDKVYSRFIHVIYNGKIGLREEIILKIQSFLTDIEKRYQISVPWVCGTVVHSIEEISRSRKMAYEFVRYTYFIRDQSLLNNMDFLVRCRKSREHLPEGILENLIIALNQMDSEILFRILSEIQEKIENHEFNIHYVERISGYLRSHFTKRIEDMTNDTNLADAVNNFLSSAETFDKFLRIFQIEFEELKTNFDNGEFSKEQTNRSQMIERAKKYIAANIDKNISILSVSEYIGISPQYFSKIFKDETGENFVDFVISLRLKKAEEMLRRNPSVSVEEAAEAAGYNNTSYFIKKFKQVYGITPNVYKNQLKN